MDQLYTTLSVISLILTICGIVGGYAAFRYGIARTANDVQEHVINALHNEIDVMHDRIADLENENIRLDQIILTICEALKKRGLVVHIEGSIVTVSDGHETQSVRIQGSER
jgi:hypothetical protein